MRGLELSELQAAEKHCHDNLTMFLIYCFPVHNILTGVTELTYEESFACGLGGGASPPPSEGMPKRSELPSSILKSEGGRVLTL